MYWKTSTFINMEIFPNIWNRSTFGNACMRESQEIQNMKFVQFYMFHS